MFFRNDRVCAPGSRCRAPFVWGRPREASAAGRASSGVARLRVSRDFGSFVSTAGGVVE